MPSTAVPATTSAPTTTTPLDDVVPAAIRARSQQHTLSQDEFDAVVADEIYRLTNCARTNTATWCMSGDSTGWNVSSAERNPSGVPLAPLGRSAALDTTSKDWTEQLTDVDHISHSPASGEQYGENVAYNPRLHAEFNLTMTNAAEAAAVLMQQWMDSPGHRSQILYPDYRHMGVGAVVQLGAPSPDTFVECWGTQQFQ